MARTTISNGMSGSAVRTAMNAMFLELYTYGITSGLTFLGILNSGDSVSGSPSQGNFYFVEDAGTYGSVSCVQYDAIFYNGSSWEKLTNFGGGKLVETQARSSGTPGIGDPLDLTTITHTLSRTYVNAPKIIIIPKCDWHLYLSSQSLAAGVVTVVVGVGGTGTAVEAEFDYDLFVYSNET